MTEELKVVPGTMLASWPDLVDPNFMHSVVLMCQHSDEGAYGLVVNRPTGVTLADLFPDHPAADPEAGAAFPVHLGGPVEPRVMQFVHTVPERIPGGVSLDGHLWLAGDLDALLRFVAEDVAAARRCVRVLLGYAGWGEGQLEAELVTGSWVPAPLSLPALFGEVNSEGAQEAAWRAVVRSVGDAGQDLSSQPPDVSWN